MLAAAPAATAGGSEVVKMKEGTLGKAFAVHGGYITGSTQLCDFVRSFASGFIFTTSLPPAVAAGAAPARCGCGWPKSGCPPHPALAGPAPPAPDAAPARRYPTVPRGTERLRITPSPLHSNADIDHLVDALSTIWRRIGLSKAAAE
jgi:5-aminolevulinate synthase